MQEAGTDTPPLVSVIIPCFNAGAMLRPALRSVIGQTHPNLEIIFVDNNSTDGSLATARQVLGAQARPHQIVSCPEQGVNHARNLGYGHARGDFIQWMDADDELAPDKIARQVAAMRADPAIDIAYGDWMESRITPGHPTALRPHRLAQDDDQVTRTLAGVWYPPHLYLLRRAVADRLQAAQAWFPGRPVATDVEYSAIAALMGLRFRHVAGAQVRYNLWSTSQIGGGTPYPKRVAALAAIFARLQDLERGPDVVLTARHRTLLNQNWDVWRMPPGSVRLTRLAGRKLRLVHTASGRTLDLRPREAAIVQALVTAPDARTTCHLALRLAEDVAAVAGDHPMIVQTLERLQDLGFMQKGASAERGAAAPERRPGQAEA